MTSDLVGAILVGGRSRRMGGAPKGLVSVREGETIVEGIRRAFRALGIEPVAVGDVGAYGETVPDAGRDLGPLAGWVAALRHAAGRPVLVVACDMPDVDEAVLCALRDAPPPDAAAAAHDGTRWVPTLARLPPDALAVAEAHLAGNRRALAGVLDALSATAVPLTTGLVDLDTPEDVAAYLGGRWYPGGR